MKLQADEINYEQLKLGAMKMKRTTTLFPHWIRADLRFLEIRPSNAFVNYDTTSLSNLMKFETRNSTGYLFFIHNCWNHSDRPNRFCVL